MASGLLSLEGLPWPRIYVFGPETRWLFCFLADHWSGPDPIQKNAFEWAEKCVRNIGSKKVHNAHSTSYANPVRNFPTV